MLTLVSQRNHLHTTITIIYEIKQSELIIDINIESINVVKKIIS